MRAKAFSKRLITFSLVVLFSRRKIFLLLNLAKAANNIAIIMTTIIISTSVNPFAFIRAQKIKYYNFFDLDSYFFYNPAFSITVKITPNTPNATTETIPPIKTRIIGSITLAKRVILLSNSSW